MTRRGLLASVAAAAAAGCAAPGGPAPAPRQAPPAAEETLPGSDGAPLALSRWRTQGPPQAVMLALHGFGDHAGSTFGEAGPWWAARGVEVWAYDQRGFGRNGSRGRWPGAWRLIADCAAAARAVRAARPVPPLTVLGHSMGGGVALAALGEGRLPDVDRAVLAAPAAAGGAAIGSAARLGAWAAAAAAPDRRFSGRGVVRIRATDNDAALQALREDALYLSGATPREILGLIRVMDRAAAAAPRVRVPLLHLHGARDQVTPAGPARRAVSAAPGLVPSEDYVDGWHLLLRDRQREATWRDALRFALEGLGP